MRNADAPLIGDVEAAGLFAGLSDTPALLLAVSGGPDSTALLWLVARWRAGLARGPRLVVASIDHGLRSESAAECTAVAETCATLGVPHRTLIWSGPKPLTGLHEAARTARYRLLADVAREIAATHILTGHTSDDQAETVLMRLAAGSGIAGLGGMARLSLLPGNPDLTLVRPLLDVPKARLIATLRAADIGYADDPSNGSVRFARGRMRQSAAALAREGLSRQRLTRLADRVRRADAALEAMVDDAATTLSTQPWNGTVLLPADGFARLPVEIAIRLLGRVIAATGDEGSVELGKLEALYAALTADRAAFRGTLAGALVTCRGNSLTIERAPPRRTRAPGKRLNQAASSKA